MRFKTTTLVALVATCSLVVAASASAALPEFKGTFPTQFQVLIRNHVLVERPSGETWQYESATMTGELTGPNTLIHLNVTFKKSSNIGVSCDNTTEGTEKGLKFTGLTGRLGYINKTTKEVGLLITAPTQPWGTCTNKEGKTLEYMGQWIGKVGPINIKQKLFSISHKQKFGKSTPSFFEGEAESVTKYPLALGKCLFIEGFCVPGGQTIGIETTEGLFEMSGKEFEIAA